MNTVFPLLDIIHILKDNSNRRAIIFTSSRKLTEYLARRLSHHFKPYCYHAGLMKEERIRIERDFRNEEGSVLVSTCAFGMGVDLPSVRTVIHYNLIFPKAHQITFRNQDVPDVTGKSHTLMHSLTILFWTVRLRTCSKAADA